MKSIIRPIRLIATFALCMGLLINATSCVVFIKKDKGKHKGWFKNPKNPHHPKNTNPGNSKVKPIKAKK